MFDTIRNIASVPVVIAIVLVKSVPIAVDNMNQAICNKIMH